MLFFGLQDDSPTLVVDAPTGSLVLNAIPWAEVDSISPAGEDPGGETNLSLGENPVTPLVVQLPSGTYRVRISNPVLGETLEFDVDVKPQDATVIHKSFERFDLEAEVAAAVKAIEEKSQKN
jgi:hypothetical protein